MQASLGGLRDVREVAEDGGRCDEHEVVVALVDEELDRVLALEEEVRQVLQRGQARYAEAEFERTLEVVGFDIPPATSTAHSTVTRYSSSLVRATFEMYLVNWSAAKSAARFAATVPTRHVAGEYFEMSLFSPRPDNFEYLHHFSPKTFGWYLRIEKKLSVSCECYTAAALVVSRI